MGRNKFTIETSIDSTNLSIYLKKWQNDILNEYRADKRNTEKEYRSFSEFIDVLCNQAEEEDYPVDVYWHMQTLILYHVGEERRNAIRTTLRAKRNKKNNKKQLTIHDDVYVKLKKYSQHQNMTLSDAIKSLLLLKGN